MTLPVQVLDNTLGIESVTIILGGILFLVCLQNALQTTFDHGSKHYEPIGAVLSGGILFAV